MGRPSSFSYTAADVSPVPSCPATTTPIPPGAFSGIVNSVGDNGPFALERMPTVGASIPALMTIRVISNNEYELQDWVLDVGTNATDAYHQRPNDFNAASNARCWTRYR